MLITAAAVGFAPGQPVIAQVVDNPVIDIKVEPMEVRDGQRIRTDVTFCVENDTASGDTFSIELPTQFAALPDGFAVNDPDGLRVANAVIAGDPQVATFTFTDYVDSRIDVCGGAFFESGFETDEKPGSTVGLTFVVNGDVTYERTVVVGELVGGPDRESAQKGGFFTDPGDQCRTETDSCMAWAIESKPGPFESVVISDGDVSDARFECDQLRVALRSVNADGSLGSFVNPVSVSAGIETSCSPETFTVTVTNVPESVLVRVVVRATPDDAPDEGGTNFENTAVVAHSSVDGTPDVDVTRASRRSSSAGGQAVGVVPSTTSTTTPEESTTTVVATTTTPEESTTTTSIVESGAVPPATTPTTVAPTSTIDAGVELPATGSQSRLAVVAALTLLCGLGLAAVAARRPA